MIVALLWNILFLLALRDVLKRARIVGASNLRFLTRRSGVAWLLVAVGVTFGLGLLVVLANALVSGSVDSFCKRCQRYQILFENEPFTFVVTVAAVFELVLTMFFVAFLACNSLRAIRTGMSS